MQASYTEFAANLFLLVIPPARLHASIRLCMASSGSLADASMAIQQVKGCCGVYADDITLRELVSGAVASWSKGLVQSCSFHFAKSIFAFLRIFYCYMSNYRNCTAC